jgi:hypothetical protein
MTSYDKVYDVFLGKILEDEWGEWTEEEVKRDLNSLMEAAITWFKFPRVSLERGQDGFVEDLSNEEIQIIATFMKCEWLNRTILTWENVKPLYDEKDFSQANLLDKFKKMLEQERKTARKLESIYYRSINGKPYKYRKWAGNNE